MAKKSDAETIIAKKTGRTLAIYFCTAGQHFGTYAELRYGSKVVASTDVRPYGFTDACRRDAVALAETL